MLLVIRVVSLTKRVVSLTTPVGSYQVLGLFGLGLVCLLVSKGVVAKSCRNRA
jgi:hypothetical protein